MISRRHFLLMTACALIADRGRASNILPDDGLSAGQREKTISWLEYRSQMTELANKYASSDISQQMIVDQGSRYLKQLDINSTDFENAVANAFESGNHYWLWQRLIKGRNINGGILNIHHHQAVPLHDHPGATGILRIISGKAEIWQFDEVNSSNKSAEVNEVELQRVSYRILKAGDMAVLTPQQGNIHALRALTGRCRMLDFFIPPYDRSRRSWYEPLTKNWFDKAKVACRKISQDEFLPA